MPVVSRFFGMVITMYYNDHPPPHFHVRYGSQKALVAIDTLSLLRGGLSPRVRWLVVEWASQHQAALAENWSLAKRQQPLQPIQPLEQGMLKDVVEVQPTQDYCLRLHFEDGAEGEVDVAVLIQFEGIFAPLKDHNEFLKVFVDPELGTICWPNGADLDPDVLYAKVTGEDITVSQPLESQKLQ